MNTAPRGERLVQPLPFFYSSQGLQALFRPLQREQVRNLFYYYARCWNNEVRNWKTQEWDGA